MQDPPNLNVHFQLKIKDEMRKIPDRPVTFKTAALRQK